MADLVHHSGDWWHHAHARGFCNRLALEGKNPRAECGGEPCEGDSCWWYGPGGYDAWKRRSLETVYQYGHAPPPGEAPSRSHEESVARDPRPP